MRHKKCIHEVVAPIAAHSISQTCPNLVRALKWKLFQKQAANRSLLAAMAQGPDEYAKYARSFKHGQAADALHVHTWWSH